MTFPTADARLNGSAAENGGQAVEPIGRGPQAWVVSLLIALIHLYQRCISPLLGSRCRFYPSCSSYCALALRRHGLARGLLLSGVRVCKCQPFHPGGVDFP